MDKESTATETNASAIAPKEETKAVVSTPDDLEARFLASEAEKKALQDKADNYQRAYIKERRKNKGEIVDDEEDDDDRIRRISEETIANSRLAEIAREQDEIIKKALKENKELKLAQVNRPSGNPVGSHTEGQTVTDTSITPEQLAYFKSKNWSDQDIERYKKNARKNNALR